MGKAAEMETLISSTENSEEMLIYSLVVPLVFMVFMSFGMEKVWSLYLMLQIAGNINNFDYSLSCQTDPTCPDSLL